MHKQIGHILKYKGLLRDIDITEVKMAKTATCGRKRIALLNDTKNTKCMYS